MQRKRSMARVSQYIKPKSIKVRVGALALCLALLFSCFSIIFPLLQIVEPTKADPDPYGGGTNDLLSDTIMKDSSYFRTSGNANYTLPAYSGAYVIPGTWKDGLNQKWVSQCIDEFRWAGPPTTGQTAVWHTTWAWNGTEANTGAITGTTGSTDPQALPNKSSGSLTMAGTWSVYSGQQLRYALTNCIDGDIIQLMQDLDLNGNLRNWTPVTMNLKSVTINGNYKTIYNLGVTGSSAGATGNTGFVKLYAGTVKNLKFASAKVVVPLEDNVSLFGNGNTGSPQVVDFTDVHIIDSLFYGNDLVGGFVSRGATNAPDGCTTTFNQCSVEDTYFYGKNHVSSYAGGGNRCTANYSYAVDNIIVSWGGHSGGFYACADFDSHATNCFAVNKVYGSVWTGGFTGTAYQTSSFENCYTSGSVEGSYGIGGFLGVGDMTNSKSDSFTANNCYTTAMVGMQSKGEILGGFVGQNNGQITNCYSAGEVGNIDTVVDPSRSTFTDVGGFVGVMYGGSIDNSYYDKQTSAMREWEGGTHYDGGAGDIAGLKGVYSSDTTKMGTAYSGLAGDLPVGATPGFTGFAANSHWLYVTELYPQLRVFASAASSNWNTTSDPDVLDKVMAYSQASASTAFLNTYSKSYDGVTNLPLNIYDTVRDLTVKFPLSTKFNSIWAKTENTLVTLYGASTPVLRLLETVGHYYADEFAPGIQWLTTTAYFGSVEGKRDLRIVPTVNLTPGETKNVFTETRYDHADDVRMAYSTGARFALDPTDITEGVYPDSPLNNSQNTIQERSNMPAALRTIFDGENDKYTGVNVSHMALNKNHTTLLSNNADHSEIFLKAQKVVSIGNLGLMDLGSELPLDNNNTSIWSQKFNERSDFVIADEGKYALTYIWQLNDGRYMQSGKVITITKAKFDITINAVNPDQTPNGDLLYLDAHNEATANFGPTTRQSDTVSQNFASPSHVSWKPVDSSVEVTKLTIKTGTDETGWRTDVFMNPKAGDSFQTSEKVHYIDFREVDGAYYMSPIWVTKTYWVQFDSVTQSYYIKFDKKATHQGPPDYSWEDVEDDVICTLEVHAVKSVSGNALKFTGYDMTNGVNGNTGMTAAGSGTTAEKYFGNVYANGSLWFTPYKSDVVMKVNPITGQATGYPLTAMQNATPGSTDTAKFKFHGNPVFDGQYLWFPPYESDRLLRMDPATGAMVGFDMANGVNGNTGMTPNSSGGTTAKFTSLVYDGRYIWMIPGDADRMVRVDPATGRMTGFAISGPNIDANSAVGIPGSYLLYEAAAFDGTSIWMAPYHSDKVVKVSNLGGAPTFVGYNIAGTDITPSCVGTNGSKFHGAVFDGSNVWITPAHADRVVKISNLSGTPTFTGFDLTNGVNGNVGMTSRLNTFTTSAKFVYPVFDGESVWMSPSYSDRLVKLDPATGTMTGYVIPLYKSMTDDIPYDMTDFHNYYNNNNWGMTTASASDATAKYTSISFDGNNLWFSPRNSDRVLKVSPSVDETVSFDLANKRVTAHLANYMQTGATIDKIEWLRVDTANNAVLTYKGNTQTPYIDTLNPTTNGFDSAYAAAAAGDKGTVTAWDAGGDHRNANFTFNVTKNGTYYVKAYFTDPLNRYGNASYNTARGSAQTVVVIKEVQVVMDVKLHIRQVVLGTTYPTGLALPLTGFMTITNVNPTTPSTMLTPRNVATRSGLDLATTLFSDFTLPMGGSEQKGYRVDAVIPQYFTYDGFVMTDTNTTHLASARVAGIPVADYTNPAKEYWLTVYLKPADNPKDHNTDNVNNPFGSIAP